MSITLVTAGAGTGKTHHLVSTIVAAMTDAKDPVPPERVVAVTFTRAAAFELFERVFRRLLQEGHLELAHRLGAAKIGTVHAVCQRLIEAFAFDLGLSPRLVTLEEHVAKNVLSRVIELEMDADEVARLDDLSSRMTAMRDFDGLVRDVVEMTRVAGLTAQELRQAATIHRARLQQLLPETLPADEIEGPLLDAVEAFVTRPGMLASGNNKLRYPLQIANAAFYRLQQGLVPPWADWLVLCEQAMLRSAAALHIHHPRLHADLHESNALVHVVAARVIERYADAKRAMSALDFVDQELLALRLLERRDLLQRIAEHVSFVAVDELQDTSPQQLEIFRALSRLAARSVWVGDHKQSIYGFRGAEPELVARAIRIDVTDTAEPLTRSYRSRPELVDPTSEMFAAAFARAHQDTTAVRLSSACAGPVPQAGHAFEFWPQDEDLNVGRVTMEDAVAAGIVSLLRDGMQVRDRNTNTLRDLVPSDIAVLARRNNTLDDIAQQLTARGVDVSAPVRGVFASLEARLVRAGLSLWQDGSDVLAAHTLARVLWPRDGAWLNDTVSTTDAEGRRVANVAVLSLPAIALLVETAKAHRGVAIPVAFDHVVRTLGIWTFAASQADHDMRTERLSMLRAHAERFVERARISGRSASVPAYVETLKRAKDEDEIDNKSAVTAGTGVVLSTWHRAKGLEWPVVVLCDLNRRRPPSLFGPQMDQVGSRRAPRAWISPYRAEREQSYGLAQHLKDTPEQLDAQRRSDDEDLRLLYVAWTRARDRLCLVGTHRDLHSGVMRQVGLTESGGRVRLPSATTRPQDGVAFVTRRILGTPHNEVIPPQARPVVLQYAKGHSYPFIQKSQRPSSVEGTGRLLRTVRLGGPIVPHQAVNDDVAAVLGSCVHAFLAVDLMTAAAKRHQLATQLLQQFEVNTLLSARELVAIGTRLKSALSTTFGPTQLHAEYPMAFTNAEGTRVRGQIDLWLKSDAHSAIIDHKTYVLDVAASEAKAPTFYGQLATYAEGVARVTGTPPTTWVHLPLAGILVEIGAPVP